MHLQNQASWDWHRRAGNGWLSDATWDWRPATDTDRESTSTDHLIASLIRDSQIKNLKGS